MREDLYVAINNFLKTNPSFDTDEEERYVKFLLRDFKRNGLDKD